MTEKGISVKEADLAPKNEDVEKGDTIYGLMGGVNFRAVVLVRRLNPLPGYYHFSPYVVALFDPLTMPRSGVKPPPLFVDWTSFLPPFPRHPQLPLLTFSEHGWRHDFHAGRKLYRSA